MISANRAPARQALVLLGLSASIAAFSALCAPHSQAFTLIDNTAELQRSGGNVVGPITPSPSRKVALSFSTSSDFRPYNRFVTSIFLTDTFGAGTLSSLTLDILEVQPSGDPTAGLNVFSQTFTNSTLGAIGAGYNSFYFDTISPKLSPNKFYSFVFSTNSPGVTWQLNQPTPAGFTPGTDATAISGYTFNGTSWASASAPAFFLNGVPGPLPILGAGSAFAWSRRMRRRVSSAKINLKRLSRQEA